MFARRLTLALCIAVAVSGVFTFWLSKRFARSRASSMPRLVYVATSRQMNAGDTFKTADLKQVTWLGSSPLAGAFTRQEDLEGRTVLYPLAEGEPVLERQLATAGSGVGLSPRIPEGMRALSLKSDQVVGVAGFLLPGTRVDVLVTYHTPSSPEPVTSTVLQDAQILAAGQKIQPDPDGKASTVDVVTLLVTPRDAEKAVLASAQGTVHFVLRNGADHSRTSDLPTQISALGGVATAVPHPASNVQMKPALEKKSLPKKYHIEVLNGEKQTVETF